MKDLTGEMKALRGQLKEINDLIPGKNSSSKFNGVKLVYQVKKLGEEEEIAITKAMPLIEQVKARYEEYYKVYQELKALKMERST